MAVYHVTAARHHHKVRVTNAAGDDFYEQLVRVRLAKVQLVMIKVLPPSGDSAAFIFMTQPP
jgi:hypothetical protein